MSLRPKSHPPGGYQRDHFHGRYICNRCSAEVHDWRTHDAHHAELDELLARFDAMTPGPAADPRPVAGPGSIGPDELAARANAEGRAVVGEECGMWRGGLREIGALVAADWAWLRRLARRQAPEPVPAAADPVRAAQWAAMGPLIARTTGRTE